MGKQKKKRCKQKLTAQARQFLADVLAGTISGLIVLAVQRLLNW